jgi:hypothetical protein
MTNTLHRHGSREGLRNDFVVFAIPCRGKNEQDSVPKLKEFLRRASKYNPVNMGNGARGAIFRPNKKLNPLAHWFRKERLYREDVIEGVARPSTVAAVFDNREAVVQLIRELREVDLGLSVNVSALIEEAKECCRSAGLRRHSVEYSLKGMGRTERMAEERVLELSMMCGHGMISFNFSRKMIDWVRQGRRTPDQASEYLGRLCTCGVFNPARASSILREASLGR